MHRPMLVYRQPNLLCIDGIPVSTEERAKAELYFMEQAVNYFPLLRLFSLLWLFPFSHTTEKYVRKSDFFQFENPHLA